LNTLPPANADITVPFAFGSLYVPRQDPHEEELRDVGVPGEEVRPALLLASLAAVGGV